VQLAVELAVECTCRFFLLRIVVQVVVQLQHVTRRIYNKSQYISVEFSLYAKLCALCGGRCRENVARGIGRGTVELVVMCSVSTQFNVVSVDNTLT